MFKFNNVTRTLRNSQPASGGGFGGTNTHPFNAAGSNVFDQMNKSKSTADSGTNNMQAPDMQNNGMPAGSNPPPLESMQVNQQPQWSPNQAPQQGQQQPQGQTPQQGGSPLDIYNPVPDNNNQQGAPQGQQPPAQDQPAKSIFDTDIKGWENVTANVDLAAGIEPEKVQAALGGDANEFMNIIQQVARTAMTQAAYMSTRVAGQGVNNSIDSFGKTVPNLINDHQFSNMWQGDSVMNHQSAKPMVDALTAQFRQQHPQATMQEVQDQVKHYMQTFTGAMSGQQQAPTENTPDAGAGNVSLTDFFSS